MSSICCLGMLPLNFPAYFKPNFILSFTFISPLFTFFISPVMSYFSRQHEFEADAYAKQQTNAQDLSSALLKLYEDNAATLTPDPVFVAFYYSHPPAAQRLAKLQA